MKHLHYFESSKPNFNAGDTVICIDDNGQNQLTKNMEYIILKVYYSKTNGYMCHLQNLDGSFYCRRFKTKEELDTIKYNL